jgi:hypothetical protein
MVFAGLWKLKDPVEPWIIMFWVSKRKGRFVIEQIEQSEWQRESWWWCREKVRIETKNSRARPIDQPLIDPKSFRVERVRFKKDARSPLQLFP